MTSKRNEELLRRLGSPDRGVQRQACDEAAARLREDPDLRSLLHDQLQGSNLRARFATAYVLCHAERPSLRVLPALLEALGLDDGDLRWSAVRMLVGLGHLHGEVFPVLLHKAQTSTEPLRRRMALYALRELAPDQPQTQEAFLAALADADPEIRRAALSSLAKLHEPTSACLERVLRIARNDPDPRLRRVAAVVLPDVAIPHPDSLSVVRELLDTLSTSTDASLARAAQNATTRLPART